MGASSRKPRRSSTERATRSLLCCRGARTLKVRNVVQSDRGALTHPPNRRVTAAPVIVAPGEQANGLTLATNLRPMVVMRDLVQPAEPRLHLEGAGGNAGWWDVPVRTKKACVKISACPRGRQRVSLSMDGIGFCEDHDEPSDHAAPI
jgi:hypothetical protein